MKSLKLVVLNTARFAGYALIAFSLWFLAMCLLCVLLVAAKFMPFTMMFVSFVVSGIMIGEMLIEDATEEL
jgi:hypothetical protein